MDDKDRQILRRLQREGRISNQALAEAVNLSPSPCLRRLRNLETSGVIRGYSADVDPVKYGFSMTAFIGIRLEHHTKECIESFETGVKSLKEVLACYLLTGSEDYLLHVVVKDLQAYDYFIRHDLHAIKGIGSIDTRIVYSVVKKTTEYPPL